MICFHVFTKGVFGFSRLAAQNTNIWRHRDMLSFDMIGDIMSKAWCHVADSAEPLRIVMQNILVDEFVQLVMGQLNSISCKNLSEFCKGKSVEPDCSWLLLHINITTPLKDMAKMNYIYSFDIVFNEMYCQINQKISCLSRAKILYLTETIESVQLFVVVFYGDVSMQWAPGLVMILANVTDKRRQYHVFGLYVPSNVQSVNHRLVT